MLTPERIDSIVAEFGPRMRTAAERHIEMFGDVVTRRLSRSYHLYGGDFSAIPREAQAQAVIQELATTCEDAPHLVVQRTGDAYMIAGLTAVDEIGTVVADIPCFAALSAEFPNEVRVVLGAATFSTPNAFASFFDRHGLAPQRLSGPALS